MARKKKAKKAAKITSVSGARLLLGANAAKQVLPNTTALALRGDIGQIGTGFESDLNQQFFAEPKRLAKAVVPLVAFEVIKGAMGRAPAIRFGKFRFRLW